MLANSAGCLSEFLAYMWLSKQIPYHQPKGPGTMAAEPDNTKRINTKALRALHALEKRLNWHAQNLMEIDCEDHHVAAAIVWALELNEKALEKTRDTKREICGGSPPTDQNDQRAGR